MLETLRHINPDLIKDQESKAVVTLLLNVVENMQKIIDRQAAQIQLLKDEINRLKGEQGKPDIKANTTKTNTDISSKGKENKKKKHNKQAKKPNIPVDKIEYIDYDKSKLPADAKFKFYDEVITQDIIFKRENTLYKIAVYYSASEKKTYRGKTPAGKSYFSDSLKSFIICQNKVCDVTENKILIMLRSLGFEISAGSLSGILLEFTNLAQEQKNEILKAGLSSSYTQTDITGDRFAGQNYYTHIITNDLFTSFTTLPGKSALDVLTAYQCLTDKRKLGLIYSTETVNLLKEAKITKKHLRSLNEMFQENQILTLEKFELFVRKKIPELFDRRNIFIKVKTAFALAYYHRQTDVAPARCMLSDNAPEYNKIAVDAHALCWVHDARYYNKIVAYIPYHQEKLDIFMNRYWSYYKKLLDYKDKPSKDLGIKLSNEFDDLFITDTPFFQLNQCIKRTLEKKHELLTVLKYPEIPLHNNLAELGARRQVRKRDISLHTIVPKGTVSKDAFLTITQTAVQLGVNVFEYVKELITNKKNKISLAEIILQKIKLENI